MSHQPGTIYRMQPTSTGQQMVVSTGCGITNQNIVKSTAASTNIKNCGISILAPSAASVFILGQPYKGCQKTIITHSTLVMKVKTHAAGCKINGSTATKCYSIALTTINNQLGAKIDLVGYSTMEWYGVAVSLTSKANPITLTSAT